MDRSAQKSTIKPWRMWKQHVSDQLQFFSQSIPSQELQSFAVGFYMN